MEVSHHDTLQVAQTCRIPVWPVPGQAGLDVQGVRRGASLQPEAGQRGPGKGVGPPRGRQVQDCGRQVSEADPIAGNDTCRDTFGEREDRPDVQRLLVEGVAVPVHPVLTEFLPVVAGHDDQRPLQLPPRRQAVQQPADLPVQGGQRLVVGAHLPRPVVRVVASVAVWYVGWGSGAWAG